MSRRNKPLLEILAEAATLLPIWLSVSLATLLYVSLDAFHLSESPEDISVFALQSTLFVQLMALLKILLPMTLLIGAAVRLIGLMKDRGAKGRGSPRPPDADEHQSPLCPSCGATMKSRTARRGDVAGQAFWGCSTYPKCRGTRPVD